MGRAMETKTKRCSGGSETWTLKTAASDLRDRIRRVRAAVREPAANCKRCGKEKRQWEGIVADAGQFYEACHAQKVEKCAKEIGAAWIRKTGTTTITTEKRKRRKAWAGGVTSSASVNTNTYEVAEVLMCLRACSQANVVCIGDATATFTGLPIGGVMSKAACSAVLNYEENAWKCDESERAKQGFGTDEWDNEVVHTRYVDDVIMLSPRYCEKCLAEAIKQAYSVPFDTASQGKKLEWLEVCTETQHVRLTPRKYETVPAWASDRKELRSFFLGRITRMKEATAQDDTEGYVRCRTTGQKPETVWMDDTRLQIHDVHDST